MQPLTQQALILSLIKDDLINCRLVNGLNALGVDASNYYLHLCQTIFCIIGFEDNAQTEVIYEHYQALTKKANKIDITSSAMELDALAEEIYFYLHSSLPK